MRKMMLLAITVAGAGLTSACATVEEAVAEAVAETHRATLSSAEVVPGSGDPDGSATAELTVTDELNQICYDLSNTRNLAAITSVTINRGERGSTGPVVLRLKEANEGGYKNCVGRAEWVEDRFEKTPGIYYIQVATSEYPSGAIRGQFMRN